MRALCVLALAHAVAADLDLSWTDCGSDVGAHGVVNGLNPVVIPAEEDFSVEIIATHPEGFSTATYKVTGEVDHLPIPALKGDICGKDFTCPVKAGDVDVKLTTSLKTSVINNAKVRAQVVADTGDVMLCADLVGTSNSVVAGSTQVKPYDAFRPGELWLDTDGNRIRAHSAGLLVVGNTTYWYGADGYNSGDGANKIINVYSSQDLYNWRNHGPAFTMNCSQIPGAEGKCYADRPKVIHDAKNERFIMWMKSTPWAAIAISSSPLGPFEFHARWYPNGEHMGDPTAFHDPVSGNGFWIYSVKPDVEQRVVRVSSMDEDLLNVTAIISTVALEREAPAMFYEPTLSQYFLWTSHTTGWHPNAAEVFSSTSLDAPSGWKSHGNPTGNKTSFSSQSTYILPYTTKTGKTRFIYIADRFEPYIQGSESGRYVWLPIDVGADGSIKVSWHDEWTLDDLENDGLIDVIV